MLVYETKRPLSNMTWRRGGEISLRLPGQKGYLQRKGIPVQRRGIVTPFKVQHITAKHKQGHTTRRSTLMTRNRIEMTPGMITKSYADDNSDEDMMMIMMMRVVFIDMMMIKIYFPLRRFWFILAKIPDKLFMKLTLC